MARPSSPVEKLRAEHLRLVRDDIRDPARWIAHANACLAAGLVREADSAMVKACRLTRRPALWRQLAQFRFARHDLAGAIAAGEEMIAIAPDDPALRLVHGRLLLADDRMEEAEDHLRRALVDPATRPAAALSLGRIALFLDRRMDALAWFRRALEGDAPEPLALAQLLRHGDVASDSREAREALRLAERDDLPANIRAHLLFGYAECLLRESAWMPSWTMLERANATMEDHFRHLGRAYHAAREERSIHRLLQLFEKPIPDLDTTKEAACDDPPSEDGRPVFIIGMPRSGTSVLEQTLAADGRLVPLGERPELGRIYEEVMVRHEREGRFPLHDAKALQELRRRYFEMRPERARGAIGWTDKMPANIHAVGIAAAILPEARFLFMERRSWQDHYFSLFRHPFSEGYFYTSRIEHIEHFAGLHRRMAERWQQMLDGRCMEILFEDFVMNPDRVKKEILCFLKLPASPAKPAARGAQAVRTFSHGKAHQRAEPARPFDASPFHAMIEQRAKGVVRRV